MPRKPARPSTITIAPTTAIATPTKISALPMSDIAKSYARLIAIAIRVRLAVILLNSVFSLVLLHAVILVHQAEPRLLPARVGDGVDVDALQLQILFRHIKL